MKNVAKLIFIMMPQIQKRFFFYLEWSEDGFDFLFQSLDFSSTNAGRNDKTV